ncbi:MAG: cation-transporting P-type ATPase, partial [Clostridiaceae bacterium]
MIDWYNYSWNDVVRELQSDVNKGLSKEKIEENRKKYGENNTINLEIKSGAFLFVKQIINIYAITGLGVCSLLFFTEEIFLVSILSSIILLCVILHTVKDYNNEKNLKELDKIIPKNAVVKREGKVQKINCEELVIGDIVYIDRGDIVPADLRLINCEGLNIKESALTGDNSIIEKYSTKVEDREISLSEMKNMAFKSSFVIDGNAVAIVTAVGENTEIGKIIKGLIHGKHERNVLEKNISRIINALTIVFYIVSFFILIYNFYRKNYIKYIASLISSVYLIVVPLHIILIIGVIYLVVKKKMKNQGVDFKGLSSIQRLSNTNIIFVDKVGTLTEDKMYISKLYTNGKILKENDENDENDEENKDNIERILNIGVLCTDVKRDVEGQAVKGNLTEVSLVNYGFKKSIDKRIMDKEQERIFQIPYDSDKRIKTTLNRIEDKYRANVKGAVDKLIERC